MRVGIITYHSVCNFGANLQLLSTISYLRNRGYIPIVINWYSEELDNDYRATIPEAYYNKFRQFQEANFPLSEVCKSNNEINAVINSQQLDMIIVGSDAVVQHHPVLSRIIFPTRKLYYVHQYTDDRLFPNFFWGSFLNSEKKRSIPIVMMSVSSQNSPYYLFELQTVRQMRNALNRFSYISVRDSWTQKMFQTITKNKIVPEITPDPVFGFNYNVVEEQLNKENILTRFNLPERYMLLSFTTSCTVSESWLSEFQDISLRNGYSCVALPMPNGISFKHQLKYAIDKPITPLEWYALIKNSSGYVGNNMHPIVVSLHNGIPCFSFDNYGLTIFKYFTKHSSSKIYHILKLAGNIENRTSMIGPKKNTYPNPLFVFEKLMSFDRVTCLEFSKRYLEKYQGMMTDIMKIIK